MAVVQCNCKKVNKNNALELKNKWKASVTLGEIKETVIGVSRDNKVNEQYLPPYTAGKVI